jgi:TPR repeat protein
MKMRRKELMLVAFLLSLSAVAKFIKVLGMLQVRELPSVPVPEGFLPIDEAAGLENIEKAAYLGFSKAQLRLGAAYELSSFGCNYDPALSLHYLALAARQCEPEADMAMSKWFLCGYRGIFAKNEEVAYVHARRAAYSGLATAEFAMGYYNEKGIYTPVDLENAKAWYKRAATNGNQDAIRRFKELS